MTQKGADSSDLFPALCSVCRGVNQWLDRRGASRAGVILLEAALAVVVFAVAGSIIFSVLRDGAESQQGARRRERLADLARSAMALIESGAATPETLNGPVRAWPDLLSDRLGGASSAGGTERSDSSNPPAGGPQYELSIQTSAWGGDLTLVTIEAKWTEGGGSKATEVFPIRQLVRLSRGVAQSEAGVAR